MSLDVVHPRPTVTSRRFGHAVAMAVDGVLLYLVNVAPGWESVPFLTAATVEVLPLVNASIVVGMVANAVYAVHDPRWLRALGDLVTTGIGLAALGRIWRVHPFDFGAQTFDWDLVTQVVLVVAMAGSLVGILVALATLVRSVLVRQRPDAAR